MKFNFQSFSEELHNEFKDKLTESEVQSLLDLNESYNKDTPMSTGKRLILTHLAFRGVKSSVDGYDYSGKQINYQQEIFEGVNIWIADNLKGKSSIFKIIKYALTGKNSIKQNVKKWIQEIILNFRISDKEYTIILNLERRLKASLYNGSFKNSQELSKQNPDPIFSANSEIQYEEEIQTFFFQQFSYYGLKWTQKHSAKDNTNLVEAETSWITYFKSILLESKDFGEMYGYGSQGKKILEMLLGLELTFPINRLKIKRDRLNEQKAKERDFIAREKATAPEAIQKLRSQLNSVIQSIAEHSKLEQGVINITSLYERYNEILEKIQIAKRNEIDDETNILAAKTRINSIISKRRNKEAEKERIILEIQKVKRRIFDLNEYLEIGIFFSNLDIKHCPSCSHEISENKKTIKVKSGECYVCNEHINEDDNENDKSVYEEKLENLATSLVGYEEDLDRINTELLNFETDYEVEFQDLQILKPKSQLLYIPVV